MEATGYADDEADEHLCSDWEIATASAAETVWESPCAKDTLKVHIHLGDGHFVNALAGRTELDPDRNYVLRVRFQDAAGQIGSWAERSFRTELSGGTGEDSE